MRAVVAVALVLFGACGRRGFDPRGDGGPGGGDDDAATDAPGDAGDDAPDASAVCGNAVCEGELGETCGGCAADCNTMAVVCGNGICDPGETSATCAGDCGPSPWPSPGEETSFLNQLDALRTGGFICPGTTSTMTAPALTATADPTAVAHHTAWHIAHQPWDPAINNLCNGTTYTSLLNATGFTGAILTNAGPGADQAIAFFKTDNGTCTRMMSAGYTQASVGGIADGFRYGWAIYFK